MRILRRRMLLRPKTDLLDALIKRLEPTPKKETSKITFDKNVVLVYTCG